MVHPVNNLYNATRNGNPLKDYNVVVFTESIYDALMSRLCDRVYSTRLSMLFPLVKSDAAECRYFFCNIEVRVGLSQLEMQTVPIRLQMTRRVRIRQMRGQTRSRSKVIHENVKIRHFLRHLSPAWNRLQDLARARCWKTCRVYHYDCSER